jgi:UDP-N-acetylmuramoyl-tripeptide--D-alanyl-D-alanine ligase
MATRLPNNRATFTLAEVIEATGGTLVAQGASVHATSVSTNTRALEPGAVFVALRGPAHDGHAYLGAALEAGSAMAIVERDVVAPPSMTVVRVSSTLRALGDLAQVHVARWRALGGRTVIGITGSAGKTTTRVATAALARSALGDQLLAAPGNLNNRIGVPVVLLSLEPAYRAAVLELGTSERGEIAELCRIVQPDVGILTLIAAAHLECLGSIDGVEHEKTALYRAVNGIAVGNGDDPRVRRALERTRCARRITYGRGPADVRVVARHPIGLSASRVTLAHGGRESTFETPLVGEAGALACAAAVAAVEAAFDARLDEDGLTAAFRSVETGEGARRLVPLELASGLVIIDDAYNANPASMSSSIRAAAEMASVNGRPLVLVLGEMRELGTAAAFGHEEVGRVAAESGARLVIAVGGGETRRIAERAREGGVETVYLPSVEEAGSEIAAAITTHDLVLVKASRSVGMERVIAKLASEHGD